MRCTAAVSSTAGQLRSAVALGDRNAGFFQLFVHLAADRPEVLLDRVHRGTGHFVQGRPGIVRRLAIGQPEYRESAGRRGTGRRCCSSRRQDTDVCSAARSACSQPRHRTRWSKERSARGSSGDSAATSARVSATAVGQQTRGTIDLGEPVVLVLATLLGLMDARVLVGARGADLAARPHRYPADLAVDDARGGVRRCRR